MFKNLVSVAKAHCFSALGACRQPMSKDTLDSFMLFADSLLSFLISASPGQELSLKSEVDAISQIAFASTHIPFYCHKKTMTSNILIEAHTSEESRALKDGVLRPICDSLKAIIKDRAENGNSYSPDEINLLLVGVKRGLCRLKKADQDRLDNDELALAILATLLIR